MIYIYIYIERERERWVQMRTSLSLTHTHDIWMIVIDCKWMHDGYLYRTRYICIYGRQLVVGMERMLIVGRRLQVAGKNGCCRLGFHLRRGDNHSMEWKLKRKWRKETRNYGNLKFRIEAARDKLWKVTRILYLNKV